MSPRAAAPFRLRNARGAPLVIYFYPRDNTPGCTLEGQDFQRLLPAFKRAGARVFGISRDTLASHHKFCDKFGFGFELLADEDGAVCKQFDVIRMKNMYGRKVLGIGKTAAITCQQDLAAGAQRIKTPLGKFGQTVLHRFVRGERLMHAQRCQQIGFNLFVHFFPQCQ